MKTRRYFSFFFVFAVLGCSDNSNSADFPGNGSNLDTGEANVSVTGAISDEHTGSAFFVQNPHSFTIHLGGHDDDDFDVDITVVDLEDGVSFPSTGTYSIGNLDNDDYRADYVNRRLGGSFFGDHHYTSDLAGGDGLLTLETVSGSLITGSFEFVAATGVEADGTPVDPVTVTGEFSAVPD